MSYNNKNNQILALELKDIIDNMSSLSDKNAGDAVNEAEIQLGRVDSISKELDAPDLRALGHWMMLNLELDENNQEQIENLFESGSFYQWIEILASLLTEYNQALLPELYNALVKPNWLMKPSIPILKNFARWIDLTRVDIALAGNENALTSVAETNDEDITGDQSETAIKHVFEEVDNAILEKDYSEQPNDIADDFKGESDEVKIDLPLIVSEKIEPYYDDTALIDTHQSDTLAEDSSLEIADVVTTEDNTGTEDNIGTEDIIVDDLINSDINDLEENSSVDGIDEDIDKARDEVTLELDDEFNIEVDDIVMSLSAICQSATEVAPISTQLTAEFDRLKNLTALFSYDEIAKVSAWCQKNIQLFSESPSTKTDHFVTSGESWTWLELTNAYLTNPEEISLLSSLSTELTRVEWFEALDIEKLQNLLLFLREPKSSTQNTEITATEEIPTDTTKIEKQTESTDEAESAFKLSWDDDIHPELLEAFFEETPEIVINTQQAMLAIAKNKANEEERHTASRLAHTIKGGCAVVGITGLADYAYQLEQILDYATHHELAEEANALLVEASECLVDTFDAVQNKGPEPKEFASVFAKLCRYTDTLEDDDISLDLAAPNLPSFISVVEPESNESLVDENLVDESLISENSDVDSLIESLEIENGSTNFSIEIDDITMQLVSICNKPEDVFKHIDRYTEELQRLEQLADISGFTEVATTSQWCQNNLTQFDKNQDDNNSQFLASGEAWSWVELIGASLADPEEISHLSTLSTELMRDDWAEPIAVDTLQSLLLLLRKPDSTEKKDTPVIEKSSEKWGGVLLSDELELEDNIDNTTETAHLEQENEGEVSEIESLEQEITPEIISWDEDIHPELLAVYFQETPDQIIEVASLLHKISKGDADKEDHQHAARIAHTIKGASGVLGIDQLVKLTHQLEDILDYSVNNKLSHETAELLAESSDCLESLFEAVQNKQEIPKEYEPVLAKLTKSADSITNDVDSESNEELELVLDKPTLPDFITNNESKNSTEDNDESLDNLNSLVTPLDELIELGQSSKAADINEAQIRVPLRVIDNLLNLAGELVTSSSQVSDKIGNTLSTRKNIKEQDKRVHRMLRELSSTIDQQEKNQETRLASLKSSGLDSLEMDTYNELHSVVGLLTESILDSETIEETLGKQLGDLKNHLRTVDQLNKELSEVILNSRMVSVNTLVPRLERIVRETCRKTNKNAELIVTGNEINIDTDILNGLVDPLLHLLRNAIDHGIESAEDRAEKNKDEQGKISLDFKRQGNFIQMQLKDDGKGINPEVIYQRAIEKGLITPEQEFSEQDMLTLILHAGFTTQDNVSDISGRGVGMDVVKSAIEKLKGTLEISSNIDEGTTFSIRIPLTLVTSATLLVKVSNNQVAIPSDTIEQLYYLSPEKVIHHDDAYFIKHEGKEIVIQSLAKLLGWPADKVDYNRANNLVLIKENNKIHAVHIDEIIYSREVVIKSLSPWIDGNNGVIGATHLPDGSVAPVMNLPLLLSLTEDTAAAITKDDATNDAAVETISTSDKPLILVVDDSLSNRKALSLIIDQTEYDVVTAVDGLDALNIMNEQKVSMVFTDLEMPRMNGLEFTQSVRAWKENKHIPVVMITSRTTSKHRQLAEKAGVDDYLTKPVVTDTLLGSIEQWIKHDASIPA